MKISPHGLSVCALFLIFKLTSKNENVSGASTSLGAPMLLFKKYIKKCLKISIKYGWIDDAKMHAHAKSKIQKKKSCVRGTKRRNASCYLVWVADPHRALFGCRWIHFNPYVEWN